MGPIRNLNLIKLTFLVLTFFLASTGRAHAYLDLGTGSYIFQVLVASAFGGLFVAKTFWKQIIYFFSNIFSRNKTGLSRKKNNGKK